MILVDIDPNKPASSRQSVRNIRNAPTVESSWVREEACSLVRIKWSLEQKIAAKLTIRHKSLYRHVYADKTQGGVLWNSLRRQKQK